MMKRMKKVLILVLAATLLLGLLAGCGGKEEQGGNKKNPDKKEENHPEFVYVPEYVSFTEDLGSINECFIVGDQLYAVSWMPVGRIKELYPMDSSVNKWYFTIDGEEITATRFDMEILDDSVALPEMGVYDTATATDIAIADPMPVPVDDPMKPAYEWERMSTEEYNAQRAEAIETYVQYDEAGELIVPEGYEYYEYDRTEQVLLRISLDGKQVSRMENYALPDMGEDVQVDGNIGRIMGSAQGGLWVQENVYAYRSDPETGYEDLGEQFFLRQLDETGEELSRVDMSKLKDNLAGKEDEYFYINTMLMDAEGNIYALCDRRIAVLDPQGQFSFKLEVENYIEGLFTLGDGRIGATLYEDNGMKLKTIDPAAKSWGESFDVNSNIYNCYTGNDEYDLFYNNGGSLFGYKLKSGEQTEIVNWLNSGINSDYMRDVMLLEDGRFAAMIYDWSKETRNAELAIFSQQPYSALGDRTVLTLACMYDYEIRDAVISFNKTNKECRIEVKNYGQYNEWDENDPSKQYAGVTKLNTEIISGDVPDILVLDSMPTSQYMAQGLLEDLNPFIDKDPEIKREDLIGSVLEAASFNGGLYQTVSSFNVMTVVSPKSIVGDRRGWTIGEMRQIQSTMPEGSALFRDMTKAEILRTFLAYGDDFIDWETGKCSFNSDGFIEALEYANTFPEKIDWEKYDYKYIPDSTRLREGTLLGTTMYLYDMDSYLQTREMFKEVGMNIIGYPCESRDGTLMQLQSGMAMTSTCKNKDAAWQLLRSQFLPKVDSDGGYYRYYGGLSINRKDMDKMIERYTKKEYVKDENGVPQLQPVSWYWEQTEDGMGREVEIMPIEQAEVDAFMAIIDSARVIPGDNQEIAEMVVSEAAAFFAGQKSARDIANIIQSKMQTYVNEHM